MKWFSIILIFVIVAGCTAGNKLSGQAEPQENMVKPQFLAGPPALVYKTRKDYSNHVPVLLSQDKSRIVSYPDPKDIRAKQGDFPLPSVLEEGYLLDNRGIGFHVAYLKMTYEEYAALPEAPSRETLMNMILDKDPLTEMYNCGNRQVFKDVVNDLNALIRTGQMKDLCKVVQ